MVDTISVIASLYNEDFKYYSDFEYILPEQINTWDFAECKCASSEYINTYFNQQRFFDRLEFMPSAYGTVREMAINNEVIIVSSGYNPNLRAKEIFCREHLPFCKFIGVNLKQYEDKSHIDMSGGVFIDDSANNLMTSNADIKICFGDLYPWNKDWNGNRCWSWEDFHKEIRRDKYGLQLNFRTR